ncbi:MAG: NAD-dependent epimerase/dehydratase family protein, partial [Planctomycetota bacterium]
MPDSPPPQRIVIAGGSGFLGMNLARWLTDRGHHVTILSRSAPPSGPWEHQAWDARSLGEWASVIDGCHGVVNLTGRTVDCIKNALHKDQILRSRVESTLVLGQAVDACKQPPKVWVQMSTAHIYGDSELPCDERSALGYGLAPDVGQAWESAYDAACPGGVRRSILRTSFVLGRSGGALPKLARLARLGLGGTI